LKLCNFLLLTMIFLGEIFCLWKFFLTGNGPLQNAWKCHFSVFKF
jgi:hypothetical protein